MFPHNFLKITIISLSFFVLPQLTYAQKFYGMAKVDNNLWVDETEITVNEYRQFLNDLPKKDKKQYQPDVTVFKNMDPAILEENSDAIYFQVLRTGKYVSLFLMTDRKKVKIKLIKINLWVRCGKNGPYNLNYPDQTLTLRNLKVTNTKSILIDKSLASGCNGGITFSTKITELVLK
jgi:hypothetical protein